MRKRALPPICLPILFSVGLFAWPSAARAQVSPALDELTSPGRDFVVKVMSRSKKSSERRRVFEPGEKHCHGASLTTAMTHIAMKEALDGKPVDWLEHVTDHQYLGRTD